MSSSLPERPHGLSVEEILRQLEVQESEGLNADEAAGRKEQFGPNALPQERGRTGVSIATAQFTNIVVALLGAAAAISWLTGERLEAYAILAVLVLNAVIGFVTEFQAGRALDALRKHLRTNARVRRGGKTQEIDSADLVPGDIVLLQAGDRVPADLRILDAARLRTDEASLTGESTTVSKQREPVEPDADLGDRKSMLYLGTTVAAGRATGVVVATGSTSELGRIGMLVRETTSEKTPLEKRLTELGRRLVFLVLGIGAVVIVAGLARGEPPWRMVEVGLSLAVAAVPEGLPAVTTLILAFGVLRMARERAIVRRLAAVETLGSTTVVCSDKTGTLTLNRMTVREIVLADGKTVDDIERVPESALRLLRAAALCNDATPAEAGGEGIGDPTEVALVNAAARAGIDVAELRASSPRVGEEPFDSESKRMITEHEGADGSRFFAIKGAPSVVLKLCSHYLGSAGEKNRLDDDLKKKLLTINEASAARALRVLAIGERDRTEDGFTFLGFAGMIDPPRPEAAGAVKRAHRAGVRVVMLTGDQATTAAAIAQELELSEKGPPTVVRAAELRGADPTRVLELARTAEVFARVSPEDKLRIVDALRDSGEIVAVTGDGVNDAPALKRADIGVSMGERGTEVAKEASDIVLADDNFATIVEAIKGGRTIYANIIKFVHMMFSHNLAEVLVVFLAILFGWPLPLLPLQILWINLVTDVFPALALALEPASPRVMTTPPRRPDASLFSPSFIVLISWQAALLAGIALMSYALALDRYGEGDHARSVALFTLIAVQLGHMFNCRSKVHSAFERLFQNPYLWMAVVVVVALQLSAIHIEPLARVLRVVSPNALDWTLIGVATLLPIAVVEVQKWFVRRRSSGDRHHIEP